jgi:peptidoglycan/LPS O-acetylase OafA/YrhL
MAEAVYSVPSTEKTTGRNRFYRPELDVLRFGAAFSVFLSHSFSKDPSWWIAHGTPIPIAVILSYLTTTGGFGVDLFFALSSFLITELLLRERE